MAARVRFVTLLLVLGAGSAARPSSTQAVLSPKGVLDAPNNKPGLAELGAIAAGAIKGYETFVFARHWLSRFVGGQTPYTPCTSPRALPPRDQTCDPIACMQD